MAEIKKNRVVLLTTHAMEEADLLSDSVAILSNGKLEALGSPLELKTKYGSALQFSIICGKDNIKVLEDKVNNTFVDAMSYVNLKLSDSGYSTLTIKKVLKDNESGDGITSDSLLLFIGWLEGKGCPVEEFGISNSSLEEVFLTVTHNAPPPSSISTRKDKRGLSQDEGIFRERRVANDIIPGHQVVRLGPCVPQPEQIGM